MGQYFDYKAAESNAEMDAGMAVAQGHQERNAAYSRAYQLESGGEALLTAAGENMMRMQQNRNLALGALRAGQASQGFELSGSKRSAESSLASVLDMAIADQMRSTATQDANGRVQAAMLRKEGDAALHMGQIKGQYSRAVSQAYGNAAPWALAGQALLTGANMGMKFNAF